MKYYTAPYEEIISMDSLLAAWRAFAKGKRRHEDVAAFEMRLMDNLLVLKREFGARSYRHGGYHAFVITDPKRRDIHKASVRDRVVHHLLYQALYRYFHTRFIHDSYSCREGKGTHRALKRFAEFGRKVSRNNTRTAWVLKCDIRKFFANIDHRSLKNILARHIVDRDIFVLCSAVIDSFETEGLPGTGLPLGNLTSQLFVNVYMNEFDLFVKHELRERHYIRYADDFVFFHANRKHLLSLIPRIGGFLDAQLGLALHSGKISVSTLASGVDFLGWVHFPDYRVLRTATKRRMFKRLSTGSSSGSVQSYLGLLSHGNAWKLREKIYAEQQLPLLEPGT